MYRICVTFLLLAVAITTGKEDGRHKVRKCCPSSNQVYSFGNSKCITGSDVGTPSSPTIYNSSDGQSLTIEAIYDFQTLDGMVQCGAGLMARNLRHFTVSDDGSLITDGANKRIPADQFCVERAEQGENPSAKEYIARFCIPDPCLSQKCIKKCCPEGYAIDEQNRKCNPHDDKFSVELHYENGTLSHNEIAVRSGAFPNCEMFVLDPFSFPNDLFHILPSGELYIPANTRGKRKMNDYCIDNFFDKEQVSLKGITCFPEEMDTEDKIITATIFAYLQIISAIFLAATFVVHVALPSSRNIHGVIIMSLSFSFAMTYIGLSTVNLYRPIPEVPCKMLAVLIQFFFIAAFSWMTVMSFNFWWMLSGSIPVNIAIIDDQKRISKRLNSYLLFGWGIPLTIVGIGQLLDNFPDLPESIITPGFRGDRCWFSSHEVGPIFAYFYGPVAVLLAINTIIFILTTIKYKGKQKLRVTFALFFLMGLMWITELISWAVGGPPYYWIVTDCINILTGVFIFVAYVCKRSVFEELRLRYVPRALFKANGKENGKSASVAPEHSVISVDAKSETITMK